jgi:hypothetical protein
MNNDQEMGKDQKEVDEKGRVESNQQVRFKGEGGHQL